MEQRSGRCYLMIRRAPAGVKAPELFIRDVSGNYSSAAVETTFNQARI